VIPEILALYGDKNTDIRSCYTNEKSCNAYIHNAINTYDLSLLNTYPKRIYSYRAPIVYPYLSYGRLSDEKSPIVEQLFELYKYDELGSIVRKTENKFYLEFLANTIVLDTDIPQVNKYKEIEKNEANFGLIIETLRQMNTLSYHGINKCKIGYTSEDYSLINRYSFLEFRFHDYLINLDSTNLRDEQKINNDLLIKLFEDIINSDGSPALEEKINRLMREIFSKVITEREECINTVAIFLARSDDIEPHQNVDLRVYKRNIILAKG